MSGMKRQESIRRILIVSSQFLRDERFVFWSSKTNVSWYKYEFLDFPLFQNIRDCHDNRFKNKYTVPMETVI